MKQYFEEYFEFTITRKGDRLFVSISADYPDCRKSRLGISEKYVTADLKAVWSKSKSTKLEAVTTYFSEVDYYDDMTNVYTTPVVRIKGGKIEIGESEHGSIPKAWNTNVVAVFKDMKTIPPITKLIKSVLGSHYSKFEDGIIKAFRPVLQGKQNHNSYYANEYED